VQAQDPTQLINRDPSAEGSFYPEGKQALENSLRVLFSLAETVELEGKVQTLIVPNAGYSSSGIVSASGYKCIPDNADYSNIFIITSSHQEQFKGSSVYSVGNYITPLGTIKVNREIAMALIADNEEIFFRSQAHEREHSIEVQLPFIQYHFNKSIPIVPIIMGSSSVAEAHSLAEGLLPYFIPENLFIFCSDFSKFPSYLDAVRIDGITGDAIRENDPEQFYNSLRKSIGESVQNLATPCHGWSSILTMLYMSSRRDQLVITPVRYSNSGDSPNGDMKRVVGYWAMAGHEKPTTSEASTLSDQEKKTLLDISRNTLETYLQTGKLLNLSSYGLTKKLKQPAGVFITLHMGGRLRGSMSNFSPTEPLYLVVREITLEAAMRDDGFAPVEPAEMEYIEIEIAVLTPLQKICGIEDFQLGVHGIFMSKEGKSGALLPQVAESSSWSAEEFLGHCAREEAGIGWDGWKDADLYVFEAIQFREQPGK